MSLIASDLTIATRLRDLFATRTYITERKMFGGLAFMVADKMCICVGHGRLMCRVDPETTDALLKEQGVKRMIMRGKPLRGYLEVPYENVSTKPRLQKWLQRCLDYNATLVD
jgi:TfoX/Sxy family transcriptional regulator of competence genes